MWWAIISDFGIQAEAPFLPASACSLTCGSGCEPGRSVEGGWWALGGRWQGKGVDECVGVHIQRTGPTSAQAHVFPALAGRIFTISATWEAPFLHHIDRIQFLEAVGLRSSFSCWVSAGAHLQLLEVSCVPCHRATSIFKPAMVR